MPKIVRFKNRFVVPNIHRSRFPVGICRDVPDGLIDVLPKSAEVLDDDYIGEEEEQRIAEENDAVDLARLTSNKTALAVSQSDVNLLQNRLKGQEERTKEANRAADEAEKAEDEAKAETKELKKELAALKAGDNTKAEVVEEAPMCGMESTKPERKRKTKTFKK